MMNNTRGTDRLMIPDGIFAVPMPVNATRPNCTSVRTDSESEQMTPIWPQSVSLQVSSTFVQKLKQ